MKCPRCQADNKKEARFCRKCGAKLSLICPQCGSENLPEDNFCDQCGHNLTLPSEPPPKDLSFDEKLDKIQRYNYYFSSYYHGQFKEVNIRSQEVREFLERNAEEKRNEGNSKPLEPCFDIGTGEYLSFEQWMKRFLKNWDKLSVS